MAVAVRWALPALVLLLHAVLWPTFFFGPGLAPVVAWLGLLLVLPGASALALLLLGGLAAVKREVKPAFAVTLGCALAGLWPGLWNFGLAQVAFPFTIAGSPAGATVRLPSNQPLVVAWGGDALAGNYHAAYPDQRWAYDLVVEPSLTEAKQLTDYGCWGTEVVAPLAARVHRVHDGEPDEPPGELRSDALATGNSVVLELPGPSYLVLAHLQQGSVLVREGEQVHEGQALGRCGNSGHTSEPHIHVHLQREDPKRFPLSFARGLPLYFREHQGPPMPTGGLDERQGKAVARGDRVRHVGPPTR